VSVARRLAEALSGVAGALEAGDAIAAARAADEASRISEEARAAGVAPSPSEHALLLEIHGRAEVAARAAQERLGAEMARASTGRRAAAAYGR
jgi:hypothetical protein